MTEPISEKPLDEPRRESVGGLNATEWYAGAFAIGGNALLAAGLAVSNFVDHDYARGSVLTGVAGALGLVCFKTIRNAQESADR